MESTVPLPSGMAQSFNDEIRLASDPQRVEDRISPASKTNLAFLIHTVHSPRQRVKQSNVWCENVGYGDSCGRRADDWGQLAPVFFAFPHFPVVQSQCLISLQLRAELPGTVYGTRRAEAQCHKFEREIVLTESRKKVPRIPVVR